MDETNVLIFTFSGPSKAYQALSEIKAQPGVEGAAVVERTANGEVRIAEGYTRSWVRAPQSVASSVLWLGSSPVLSGCFSAGAPACWPVLRTSRSR
jgi:hypothetical protein